MTLPTLRCKRAMPSGRLVDTVGNAMEGAEPMGSRNVNATKMIALLMVNQVIKA